MPVWLLATLAAAILYGLHNVFTKMAAGKVSDNMGGLLLEGTATGLDPALHHPGADGDRRVRVRLRPRDRFFRPGRALRRGRDGPVLLHLPNGR